MSILAGYMVPHPPLIIPEVGRGKERGIQNTINAYERVADEIASLKPDTIVISTPHSVMYADYFHISPGKSAYGDMGDYYAPEVRMQVDYDAQLIKELSERAAAKEFPAGVSGEKKRVLDHATLIPLYFVRKKYTDFAVVRIGLSGLSYARHYQMGKLIADAVEALNRRIVYIASGDLSHKMTKDGPYGFAEEGPQYDARIMDVMGRGSFGELLDHDEDFCDRAAECGHRSFLMMAGAFDGMGVEAKALSHEAPFGVGYGVATFHPTLPDSSRQFLKLKQRELLEKIEAQREKEDAYVTIARRAVELYVAAGEQIAIEDALSGILDDPAIAKLKSEKAGAFVSLHEEGKLRGCIGTILPVQKNIAIELIRNGISACSLDPRFPPVTADELPYLEYSVDILSAPEEIISPAQLDVKKYGVIVTNGSRRGVLLPDLEGVDTVEAQLAIAKQKAGIAPNESVQLQRFTVWRHH